MPELNYRYQGAVFKSKAEKVGVAVLIIATLFLAKKSAVPCRFFEQVTFLYKVFRNPPKGTEKCAVK